jgi:hypothetical protein
MKRTVDGIF